MEAVLAPFSFGLADEIAEFAMGCFHANAWKPEVDSFAGRPICAFQ
jgi:hypothetical protein